MSAPTRGLTLILGSWSPAAARRALRAAVIVPLLLALTFKVIANPQMSTYATFGAFANLVMAAFSGGRRDRLFAHAGLGLAGSVLLSLGTVVSGSVAVAGAVTLVTTFVVFAAGVIGPNVAAGGLAAMLAYVLAAASPGDAGMVPSRLAGWWLATALAAAAVVAMTPRRTTQPLRAVTAAWAEALAREAGVLAEGRPDPDGRQASAAAGRQVQAAFNATPYRPTGLASADQALGNVIELLGWVSGLLADTGHAVGGVLALDGGDQALLRSSSEVLGSVAAMLRGEAVTPDLDRLEALRLARGRAVPAADEEGRRAGTASEDGEALAHASFHSRTVAVAVRAVAADALIASGRETPEQVTQRRQGWLAASAANAAPPSSTEALPYPSSGTVASAPSVALSSGAVSPLSGAGPTPLAPRAGRSLRVGASSVGGVLARSGLHSVWLRNSARAAVAVAAAVTIAGGLNVQHGFWVVLGTLSVLRTTATATGSTAVRAVLGTSLGFVIGAGLVIGIGTNSAVLWVVLVVALLVAAYTPGVAPFAAGQAAFTVLLVVLYNLLQPVGWRVGAVRVEDIAMGCAISLVVGALVFPRGAASVVAEDLRDALDSASRYLVEATEWALGQRLDPPSAGRESLSASLRLDDAIRAYLTEPGPKPVPKEELWALVGAAQRLRLTAVSLAEVPRPPTSSPAGDDVRRRVLALSQWYAAVGGHVRHHRPPELVALDPLPGDRLAGAAHASAGEGAGHVRACILYVDQHVRHLYLRHADVLQPAAHLADAVHRPWWHPGPPGTMTLRPSTSAPAEGALAGASSASPTSR
jgi:uncharacterized membrane protein YccC